MLGTVMTLVVLGHRRGGGRRGRNRRLGIFEQQRVLHEHVPRGAPRGAEGACRVVPRPRELRRVPHGPDVDAAADGDQADAHQRALGHDRRLRAPDPHAQPAPGARVVRGVPLAGGAPQRHDAGEVPLRRRREEHGDQDHAAAAHRHRRGARQRLQGDGAAARPGDRRREGHPLAHRAGPRIRRARPRQAEDPAGRGARQERQGDGDAISIPPPGSVAPTPTRCRSGASTASTATTRRAIRSAIRRTSSTTRSRRAASTAACRRSRRAPTPSSRRPAAISGPEAERAAKFAELIAAAAPQGGETPKTKDAEQKFAAEMKRILLLTSFAAKDLTWKTFPNNVGHKDFPGCFRCHDGKHTNDKGEAIRLQCTLCHALPSVVAESGVRTVQSDRESRPHAAVESRRAELDARSPHAHSTTAARCATARSSGARTAAASAPIRRATGASGRK